MPFWKKQKTMIMISIASGPNSAKPITTQQRMYWVGKGKGNVLGRKSSKPWISPESWVKVEERKQLKGKAENAKSERIQRQLRAKYKSKDKEVKKSLKSDKRE